MTFAGSPLTRCRSGEAACQMIEPNPAGPEPPSGLLGPVHPRQNLCSHQIRYHYCGEERTITVPRLLSPGVLVCELSEAEFSVFCPVYGASVPYSFKFWVWRRVQAPPKSS